VVNFVATTHPLGQKRCYRGDGSQISFRTQRTLRNQGPFDIYKWTTRPVHWGRSDDKYENEFKSRHSDLKGGTYDKS